MAGIILFAFPLYYQYRPLPPYPIRYAVWWALGWAILGVLVTAFLTKTRPAAIEDTKRVYVEDETVAAEPARG